MALPAYPSALPLPLENVTDEYIPDVIRTDGNMGLIVQYRRGVRVRRRVGVTIRLTGSQYQTWLSFWKVSLAAGANKFTMQLKLDDVLDTYTVRIIDGSFSSNSIDKGWWDVKFQLEIL